ncbi:CHAD domain-containing protein [Christiangramia salexigens]|uniref:CHAD domain-containing protein n=1 Tax=Christiangramia salexigens TaxID=1913577 RepID=A0A1L3J1Q7_9FLAO|nr:CHAD domain-containing protein [Christiangramia salexigens]APG59055.1 hypothetical protein LPB144_00930 [Christiangramia salexigens]
MEYRFDRFLSLEENAQFILREEINACLSSLDEMKVHDAVHEIRKRLKKIRALARLFRGEFGEAKFRSINNYFKEIGNDLSEIRDLTAHIETLELLKRTYGPTLNLDFFIPLNENIEAHRIAKVKEMMARDFFSKELRFRLNIALDNLNNWSLSSSDINIILPGIKKVYARGKKNLKRSYLTPDKTNFHNWRKRTKYLWYQTLLLEDIWPGFFKSMESEIHELADLLGTDHDLMVLHEKINDQKFYFTYNSQKALILEMIKRSSSELRQKAKTKGQFIYAETPGNFIKRIKIYADIGWN